MRSLILTLLLAVPLAAQESKYEQILVPFDTMTMETAGAMWRAELWVRNDGTTPVNVWAEECFQFGHPVSCGRRVDVPAGRTMQLDLFDNTNPHSPGVVLYVQRERSRDLTFDLRVRDIHRGLDDLGTELPVIRYAQLRTGITSLINVPLQPNGRLSLRIYSPAGGVFKVRMYAEPTGDLLEEETFVLGQATDFPVPPIVPVMIDASAIFPGWVVDRVRVEVEPVGSSPYYPLLTITNRRNNHITTVTPQ